MTFKYNCTLMKFLFMINDKKFLLITNSLEKFFFFTNVGANLVNEKLIFNHKKVRIKLKHCSSKKLSF